MKKILSSFLICIVLVLLCITSVFACEPKPTETPVPTQVPTSIPTLKTPITKHRGDPQPTPCPACPVGLQEVIPESFTGMKINYVSTKEETLWVSEVPFTLTCPSTTPVVDTVKNSKGTWYVATTERKCIASAGTFKFYPGSCSIFPGYWLVEDNTLEKHAGVNQSDILLWLMKQQGLSYKDALALSLKWHDSPAGISIP
jgi:hypothetical protein